MPTTTRTVSPGTATELNQCSFIKDKEAWELCKERIGDSWTTRQSAMFKVKEAFSNKRLLIYRTSPARLPIKTVRIASFFSPSHQAMFINARLPRHTTGGRADQVNETAGTIPWCFHKGDDCQCKMRNCHSEWRSVWSQGKVFVTKTRLDTTHLANNLGRPRDAGTSRKTS